MALRLVPCPDLRALSPFCRVLYARPGARGRILKHGPKVNVARFSDRAYSLFRWRRAWPGKKQALSVSWSGTGISFLLYNGATYETADVISTYVYRQGIESHNFGYATAVGLFNSVISFAIVYGANRLSRRVNDMSIW